MEELRQTIAKNLINFRTSAGLTQFELAEKINYSDKSISKWERGLAVPDVLVLKQLADLYGVKVDDFFTEGENIERIELAKTSKTGRHILITLLSAGLVWLVATLCFVVLYWLGIERAWLSFIVAIPVCTIVLIVFSVIWAKLWVTATFVSILVWTIAMTGHLIFYWTNSELLYLLCIPIQVLVIMWYILMYILKSRKNVVKTGNLDDCSDV